MVKTNSSRRCDMCSRIGETIEDMSGLALCVRCVNRQLTCLNKQPAPRECTWLWVLQFFAFFAGVWCILAGVFLLLHWIARAWK